MGVWFYSAVKLKEIRRTSFATVGMIALLTCTFPVLARPQTIH